jgi:hypothetical protein
MTPRRPPSGSRRGRVRRDLRGERLFLDEPHRDPDPGVVDGRLAASADLPEDPVVGDAVD